MAGPNDGGEAVLEALRNLGVDYIISSPGSEWPPVWEALARQQANETPGPKYINCWHETLAVTIAMGYTRATGRMQAVLLHGWSRPAARGHGHSWGLYIRSPYAGLFRRIHNLWRRPKFRSRRPVVPRPQRSGRSRPVGAALCQVEQPRPQPVCPL